MADDPKSDSAKGEGSYQGTRDYNQRTEKFLDANRDKLDELAEDAAEALDGAEGKELEQAEAEGKAHAKR